MLPDFRNLLPLIPSSLASPGLVIKHSHNRWSESKCVRNREHQGWQRCWYISTTWPLLEVCVRFKVSPSPPRSPLLAARTCNAQVPTTCSPCFYTPAAHERPQPRRAARVRVCRMRFGPAGAAEQLACCCSLLRRSTTHPPTHPHTLTHTHAHKHTSIRAYMQRQSAKAAGGGWRHAWFHDTDT